MLQSCSATVLQFYCAAMLMGCSATVLQCYCAAVILYCSATVLLCSSFKKFHTDIQTYRATIRGPSGPKKQGLLSYHQLSLLYIFSKI